MKPSRQRGQAASVLIVLFVLIVMISNNCIHGKPMCNYDQFVIEDIFGNRSCAVCPDCPVGHGLTPQCGSIINYGGHFKCEPCKAGESYSIKNDFSSCKLCGMCTDHMTQISKCTPTQNSKCGKSCERGFYYSEVTFDCQKCSWCCKGSRSSPIKACQVDGIPFYRQCSADYALFCQPKCTNKQFVFVDKSLNQTCINCPKCPVGKGLSPRCSSVITNQNEPKCLPCDPGKTFSDVKDSSTCKKCSACGIGKKIERICNITHDTLCGDCKHGFYNGAQKKGEVKCMECSFCCGDNLDTRMPECQSQGMPTDQQCAFTDRAVTKCHPKSMSSPKLVIIVSILLPLLAIAIVIFSMYFWYKNIYYKNKYKKCTQEEDENSMGYRTGSRSSGKENPSRDSTTSCVSFPKSGVKVLCNVDQVGQQIIDKVSVEICHGRPFPKLKQHEVPLSPIFKLTPEDLSLEQSIRLQLFHSAHVEKDEMKNWSITVMKLKCSDSCLSEWDNLGDLKDIDIGKGWVEFSEIDFGSYFVVGTHQQNAKHSKKRMCCVMFGETEPRINAPYSMYLHIIDDSEPSLKRLQYEENNLGQEMMASYRIFYPDVHPKSSISINIENISEGWMVTHFPKKLSSEEWRNSYKTTPKMKTTFEHQESFKPDFRCTFIVKLNDNQVAEIPVLHYFTQRSSSTQADRSGIQVQESHSSQGHPEYETAGRPVQLSVIDSAKKLFPDISDKDIDLICVSANPGLTLADMVKRKHQNHVTPEDLSSAITTDSRENLLPV